MRTTVYGAAVLALLAMATPDVAAQIDYRNLDDDRPVRIEDAYSIERYAFELIIPYAFERERGGVFLHASNLELAYGFLRNAHVGVKVPIAAVRAAGATEWGASGLRAFVLYNFNSDARIFPAFALRADANFPVGSLSGSETHVAFKAIITRSIGRNRIHLNGAYRFGADGVPAAVESLDRWWAGAAMDRILFRQSLLLIGEVYAAQPLLGTVIEVNASAGLRWQWRPTTVLDLGFSRRLRQNGPDLALTIGMSNAFAIRGLMPRGR